MRKTFLQVFLFLICALAQSQSSIQKEVEPRQDSINKQDLLNSIGNGYYPTKYFNSDLRYLIKYNQYEGIRTGLGGITNESFSKIFRINGYVVYGFRDHRFKYSIGGGLRVAEKTNTWINLSYTDDLQETGSTNFLTDGRFFQFFEPRLLNIDLFHKHITKSLSVEHQFDKTLFSDTEFSISNVNTTYDYAYLLDNVLYDSFHFSTLKAALRWSPNNKSVLTEKGTIKIKEAFPQLSIQYSKSFNDLFGSNFGFSKWDFKAIHRIGNEKRAFSEITLVSGIAEGATPLTHLYHAYPNNIRKETILQRFSVAGLNSFETMYFNEFFSDKFVTFQYKYFLKPFQISRRFHPQMVLITRYALGDIENIERHQSVNFSSLKKGYTESGFELNKLLFGFGLSFTYRYGAYHLPDLEDNVALKFTFNVTL